MKTLFLAVSFFFLRFLSYRLRRRTFKARPFGSSPATPPATSTICGRGSSLNT